MRTRSADTRESILTATLRLLGSRDFSAIGTLEIAREAGVSEGTIFRYFPAKADIYTGLVREKVLKLVLELRAELDAIEGPLARLEHLGRRYVDFITVSRDVFQVILRELTYDSEATSNPLLDQMRSDVHMLEGLIEEGARQGVFEPGSDARALAMLFHGGLHSLLLEEKLFAKGKFPAKLVKKRAEAYRRALMSAIRPVDPRGGR